MFTTALALGPGADILAGGFVLGLLTGLALGFGYAVVWFADEIDVALPEPLDGGTNDDE